MITKVILRNFKRFKEQIFELDSQMVFAGQNNSGKTSVLQAIATWHFALQEWLRSGNEKQSVSLLRNEFAPVPVREFNQLWTDTSTGLKKGEKPNKTAGTPRVLEIEVHGVEVNERGTHNDDKWSLTMVFKYRNRDQVYARPKVDARGDISKHAKECTVVHIPSFSGISLEEIKYETAYQDILIGQGKPGDILRNLLLEVSTPKKQDAEVSTLKNRDAKASTREWEQLCAHVKRIFNYELIQPVRDRQAYIVCNYRPLSSGGESMRNRPHALDINTAGSGFQQVLLLLAFIYARPGVVLLIDEPDAHLHTYLQGEIYLLLKNVTAKNRQLFVATHSEVLIDATSPSNIISFFGKSPRRLSDSHERMDTQEAMRELSSSDLLGIQNSGGRVLFVEDRSDSDTLCAWADTLTHSVAKWFTNQNDGHGNIPFVISMKGREPDKAKRIFRALQAFSRDVKGFIVLDSDGDPRRKNGLSSENPNLVIQQWNRYEVENYLIVPEAIKRFLDEHIGPIFTGPAMEKLRGILPPAVWNNPLEEDPYLVRAKASNEILDVVFRAADFRLNKPDYYRLAACMKRDEVHQDVIDMLDAIAKHFELQ